MLNPLKSYYMSQMVKQKLNTFVLLLVLSCSSNLVSQTKVDGLLSINEFYGKVVSAFDGTYFWVKHNGKYDIYDKSGQQIQSGIPVKNQIDVRNYQNTFAVRNGILISYDSSKFGERFISLKEKKQLGGDHIYSTIIPYDNGTYFAIKELDKQFGKMSEHLYLDENLNVIYKIKESHIKAIQEKSRSILTSEDQKRRLFGSANEGFIKHYDPTTKTFGFINTKGETVIPHAYKAVGDFSEGLAFFRNEENLYGFINNNGETVIPAKYSKQPYSFFNDRARVLSKDGYWGFINGKDQLVIDATYKFATNFYKNHALVRTDQFSSILLIDTDGNVIHAFDKNLKIDFQEQANIHQTLGLNAEYFTHINPVLKQLVDFGKGIFTFKNKSGLVDSKGNVVLDFNYKSLKDYNNGLMLAIITTENNKEKHGLINEQGTFVVTVGQSKF
ncbi:WG repeat-containing protein [Maribacter sp. 2-571]|uniref:WG repeat-containing protein n=1 Tax=Maribacter sp. 2-571 TaxID=3417569 RepID=UPI003D35842F